MPRKKADKTPPKEVGRPPLTARAGKLIARGLHALRPAWVVVMGGVAYLGLVFVLESAATAHEASRIQKIELDVQPPPAMRLPGSSGANADSTTAATDLVQFGCQATDQRLQKLLNQSLAKNPRQDVLVADVQAVLKNDAGLKSLDQVQPLFPGRLRVVVTTRIPECRLASTGRALDCDGVLLPVEMGHRPLPEYSRDSDPEAKAVNGKLVDPCYPQAIQAMRMIVAALPDLTTKSQLNLRSVRVKDAGQPAELVITLQNGARLEWGRLNDVGDYAAQVAQRRKALLAVQARYADLTNLLVVRLYDADAPVELRAAQPVQFQPGSNGRPGSMTLNAVRSNAH
ncbi:MAG TPA: hypothetical protein VL860_03600 [Planctomycetota bacterium]|jgi:hypothetical protein|nr:hypothetical protein [Planctomycetota bacterium]